MPLIRKPQGAGPHQPAVLDDDAATLASPSADARWAAARQLRGSTGQANRVLAALNTEGDPRVREALFTVLAGDGDPEAVAALTGFIRSPDAGLRTGALDALATLPDVIAARIEALLHDPDPDVRILSCDLARRLPGPVATRQLSALLEREQVANVCAAAAEVLSEVGDAQALAALQAARARFNDDEFLAFAIDAAVRTIGEGSGAAARTS